MAIRRRHRREHRVDVVPGAGGKSLQYSILPRTQPPRELGIASILILCDHSAGIPWGKLGGGVPIQITFPSAESSDATAHARELRGELADCGLPPDQLRVMRSSPESMDLGSMIEIAKVGIDLILAGHAAFSLAQVISNYAKRTRSTVNIKSDLGNIDISTERSDVTELAAILKKIAELHRDKADQ